jgi:hypothetical protein
MAVRSWSVNRGEQLLAAAREADVMTQRRRRHHQTTAGSSTDRGRIAELAEAEKDAAERRSYALGAVIRCNDALAAGQYKARLAAVEAARNGQKGKKRRCRDGEPDRGPNGNGLCAGVHEGRGVHGFSVRQSAGTAAAATARLRPASLSPISNCRPTGSLTERLPRVDVGTGIYVDRVVAETELVP